MPAELDGIGERLRVARIEAGLTLRDAARFLEMVPSRLSDLEHDRQEPYIWHAERMYQVYGFFQARKIAGRDFTRSELDSLWDEYQTARRRERFWRGSPRRA